ncbi:MAG TPA: sulfite exporter TauE/SafE family protein [Xanthobacteraceae bacterium]|nr:sulfite exporter TauE/SafE family protein [Xanthobacteraceae bacterium]
MPLPDADPLFYLLAVVAVILLGLSKGGFFGLGVMAIPLMSLYVPPLQAAAILVPTLLAQDALTVWSYRHDWSAWDLAIMIPSMAVGVAVGTVFAATMSPAQVRLAVGIIAVAFVLWQWLGRRFKPLAARANAVTAVLFGALGGFTTLVANAGGPAWQMHLLPRRLDKLSYAGTLTILFAASDIIKLPAYGALGQLTIANLTVGAALLPVAIVANWAGLWLVRRTPTALFFRIAYVLMFVIGIELIRGALTELVAK